MIRVKARAPLGRNTTSMNRGLRRSTNILALWAMLMLALVPTTGRLWKAAAGSTYALVEGGHRAGGHHGGGKQPDAPMQHADGDCAYCALASGLGSAGAHPGIACDPQRGSMALPAQSAQERGAIAQVGLGARGPPQHV